MRYADSPCTEAGTYIDAPPERVWELITDFDLMATISPELREVRWLDGADGPGLGHRFVGTNAHEALGEWQTTSTVVAYEKPTVFAWAVSDVDQPSSTWRFTLQPEGTGTTLTQWMRMGPARGGLNFAIDRMPEKEERIVARRLSELRAAIERNLAEVRTLAEAGERRAD